MKCKVKKCPHPATQFVHYKNIYGSGSTRTAYCDLHAQPGPGVTMRRRQLLEKIKADK